ncbi:hypothetical protein [Lysobacter sp. ESA13C]|uniref:hypothetical protein n=1 Tax=Lysobacter sp. ESA13C TaxID=2862676 RepID=UPI001CBAC15B|nr:hypothetical protein [Lysobacter sp. ESA13C]
MRLDFFLMAYVFSVGLIAPALLGLPQKIALRRLGELRSEGKVVSLGCMAWLAFVSHASCYMLWLAFLLVPAKFAKELNAAYPMWLWLGVPLVVGVVVAFWFRRT